MMAAVGESVPEHGAPVVPSYSCSSTSSFYCWEGSRLGEPLLGFWEGVREEKGGEVRKAQEMRIGVPGFKAVRQSGALGSPQKPQGRRDPRVCGVQDRGRWHSDEDTGESALVTQARRCSA